MLERLYTSEILNLAPSQGTGTPVSARITCLSKENVANPTPLLHRHSTCASVSHNKNVVITYRLLSSNRFIWFVFHNVSYVFSLCRGCPILIFRLHSCFLEFFTWPLTDLEVWGEVFGLVFFWGDLLKTKRFEEALSNFSFNYHKHHIYL